MADRAVIEVLFLGQAQTVDQRANILLFGRDIRLDMLSRMLPPNEAVQKPGFRTRVQRGEAAVMPV
jgi:hypothetical protein